MTDWSTRPKPVGPSRWRFPPADDWPPQDLIAAGGDLEPRTVVGAYRRGIFPMVVETPDPVLAWWSPDPRGVIPLDGFHRSRSLRGAIPRFEVRVNRAFEAVIRGCADPAREHGWIDESFVAAYCRLHELGWAHSVETWVDGELTGGLYGVHVGGAFFGESMFHYVTDGSKVALVALVERLRSRGFALLDTQWMTPHLERFGTLLLSKREYHKRLETALKLAAEF